MTRGLLGTNPYLDANKQKSQLLTQLKYDNKDEEDSQFKPLSFKSTRDHRINFERLNDKDKVLDEIKDDKDEVGFDSSKWADCTIALNVDYICGKVSFFSGEDAVHTHVASGRSPKISLNYYEEEEDTDLDQAEKFKTPFKTRGIVFKKRRKTGKSLGRTVLPAASEFRFIPYSEKKVFSLKPGGNCPENDKKEEFVHFKIPESECRKLAKADFEFLLKNFAVLSVPKNVDPIDLYFFIQHGIHFGGCDRWEEEGGAELESVCISAMKNLKNARFVDGDEEVKAVNPFAGRTRRKIIDIRIPGWLKRRLR